MNHNLSAAKPRTPAPSLANTDRLGASYGRKSDLNDAGIRDQHQRNAQKAQSDGYVIPDSPEFRFGDDYTTGVSKRRTGWDRLVEVVTSGRAPFDRVYIKDKTRFGRWGDPRYQFFWPVMFEQYGVRIIFSEVDDQPDYSSEKITPAMVGHFLKDAVDGIVASEERTRLIRRITEGMRNSVLRRFYPGAVAPYATERWLADRETGVLIEAVPQGKRIKRLGCKYMLRWREDGSVDVVRNIFAWIEEGVSLEQIALRLNTRGVPTARARGRWGPEKVRGIARNPIYRGDLIWGRSTRAGDPLLQSESTVDGEPAILYRDFMPDPPITREQWQTVREILNGNRARWDRRRATAPEYLLSSLLVCAHCGRGWHGHTSTRAEKTRRRYYRHEVGRRQAPGRDPCPVDNRYLPAEGLESRVTAVVLDVLDDQHVGRLVDQVLAERRGLLDSADHAARIEKHEKQIAQKEAALEQAIRDRAMAASQAERDACGRVVEALGSEIEHHRRQRTELATERDRLARLEESRSAAVERARDVRSSFQAASPHERKEIFAAVLESIQIGGDADHAVIELRAM